MSNFICISLYVVTFACLFLAIFHPDDFGYDKGVSVVCREAYAAKLEQQIPTCKEWIDGGLK